MKKYKWDKPEFKKMMSEKLKIRWSNPEYRKMMSEKAKASCALRKKVE